MANRENWRLCGGTFFILISDARNPMPSHAERYMGKQSGITEPETLLALARIVSPDIPDPLRSEDKSFRDGTLDFKSCKGWGWRSFLLNNASAKKSFDNRIKNSYIENIDDYSLRTDINSDYDLGYEYIAGGGIIDTPDYLVNYIDYEAFGRDLRIDLYGAFTDRGWVEKVG